MRFASRINSFLTVDSNLLSVIKKISTIAGMTDIELNYPEHFLKYDASEIIDTIRDNELDFSGTAVRYRGDFLFGEFGAKENTKKAVDLAKKAIDTVHSLGGESITIWLEFDGNDYSFQIDYRKVIDRLVASLQNICDHSRDIKVSIEFKPFEPRAYSIVPNTGVSLHILNLVDRDNVGMTLDYCHSLMAGENPALSLSLATSAGKLFGVHLNDGNGFTDDGLIFGSVNIIKTLEFMYYLKKGCYEGLVYFDTFPLREDPFWETEQNIRMFNKVSAHVEKIGMEEIERSLDDSTAKFGQTFALNHLL